MELIKVVDGIALIDSRDYCREVIKVDHGDWLQNVVYPHQSEIEQVFGLYRFENGKINGRGRPEKYLLLTEDQANALLVFSRNTKSVRKAKLSLIKEFSEARRHVKQSLERSLAAAVAPQEIKVISKEDDLEKRRKAFTRTLWGLYEDSQMHSYQYVMDCVRKNPYFVEGRDFKVIDNKKRDVVWAITEETYHLMMACFRGTKGVNLDNLNSEEQFVFTIGKFFQQLNLHEQQNLRMGQQGRQM